MVSHLKPRYAPIKVRGTLIKKDSAITATNVPKGTALEEPSAQMITFKMKKTMQHTPWKERAVRSVILSLGFRV
jgi:hypothetical protein